MQVPYGSTWQIENELSSNYASYPYLVIKDPSGNVIRTKLDFQRPMNDSLYTVSFAGLNGTNISDWGITLNGYDYGNSLGAQQLPIYKYNYRFEFTNASSGTITSDMTIGATVTRESNVLSYSLEGTNGINSTSGTRILKVSGYYKDTKSTDSNMIGTVTIRYYSNVHSAACYYEFDTSTLPTTLSANTTITPISTQYMKFYTVTLAVSPAGYGTTVYGTSNTTSLSVPYGTKISSSGNRLALTVDSTTYPNAVNNKIGSSTEAIITGTAKSADGSYTYAFSSWTNGSGTITANKTITANFTRTPYRVITIVNGSWGTVKYGSTPLNNNDTVPDGATLTITVTAANTAQYTYSVSATGNLFTEGNSKKLIVDGNETITFNRVTNTYSVSYPAMATGLATFRIYQNGTLKISDPTTAGSFVATYNDKIYATATVLDPYNSNFNITGVGTTSDSATTVQGAISIGLTAPTVKSYKLTIASITGIASQTVRRTSSPYQNANTGALNNNATIYYGDKLSLWATAIDGYQEPEVTTPVTVTKNVSTSAYIRTALVSLSAPVISHVGEYDYDVMYFTVVNNNYYTVTVTSIVKATPTSTASTLTNTIAPNSSLDITYNTSVWDGASISCTFAWGAATSTSTTWRGDCSVTIVNSGYGTVKNGSTTVTSGNKVPYGTTLTISTIAATGYTTRVSSSTGTISEETGGTFVVDGPETITFTRTGNTYYVYYEQGNATGGTLPSDQSRTYPNATTLATNNMTKSTTTDATYTVTFNYNGGTGSPTSATANKTTTYSANG